MSLDVSTSLQRLKALRDAPFNCGDIPRVYLPELVALIEGLDQRVNTLTARLQTLEQTELAPLKGRVGLLERSWQEVSRAFAGVQAFLFPAQQNPPIEDQVQPNQPAAIASDSPDGDSMTEDSEPPAVTHVRKKRKIRASAEKNNATLNKIRSVFIEANDPARGFSARELSQECPGVSIRKISSFLQRLSKLKLINCQGSSRSAEWHLSAKQ
jgi:hypothetical protein